jgi:hypothetical protein
MEETSAPNVHIEKKTLNRPTEIDLTCEVSTRDNTPIFQPEMSSTVFPSPTALPLAKVSVPFSVTSSKVIEVFVKAATKKRFQIIEQSGSLVTAVYKGHLSFKDLLLCCLPVERRSRGVVSAVRLNLAVNEEKCMRTVVVKGLYGSPQNIAPLVEEFRDRLQSLIEPSALPQKHSHYEAISDRHQDEDQDEATMTCKDEASSYYEFHKILSSEAYTLGKSLSEFLSSFMSQYRNVEESASLLPQPVRSTQLDSVKLIIEETVEALFSHFNFGRANSERMMHFCRPAVEKFVFSKVYCHLIAMYSAKTKALEDNFTRKADLIAQSPGQDVMDSLEVKGMYRLADLASPYAEAIDILSQLGSYNTALEKLNCCLNAVASMKTAVVDYWKGREELSSMDDELPILTYVVGKAKVQHFNAEIALLLDYVDRSSKLEREQRLLINLEAAAKFIANEWVLPRVA